MRRSARCARRRSRSSAPPRDARFDGVPAFDVAAFRWEGVEEKPYKAAGGWDGVRRFALAARDGFELRYFEIAPGGYSSLEKHEHAHVVIALRGRGRALVGREVVELAPFDVVETPPLAAHRWVNAGDEPFGFLCTVDAQRDRPQPLSDAEREELAADPDTAPFIR
jgi:quercetin dioxygenase-like cupin family protein